MRVRGEGVRAWAGRTIHWLQLAVIVSSIMQHHSRDQHQPDQCIVTPASPISWIWPGHGHHYITADWRRKLKLDNASIRNHKQDIHIRVTNVTVTRKARTLSYCHMYIKWGNVLLCFPLCAFIHGTLDNKLMVT